MEISKKIPESALKEENEESDDDKNEPRTSTPTSRHQLHLKIYKKSLLKKTHCVRDGLIFNPEQDRHYLVQLTATSPSLAGRYWRAEKTQRTKGPSKQNPKV